MGDYLRSNLEGEIESSKIIDEVNLFCNRPSLSTTEWDVPKVRRS